MSLAVHCLLVTGLAALITATILRDRGRRGYLLWLAGVGFNVAGVSLNAVVDLREHRLVHACVLAVVVAVFLTLAAISRRWWARGSRDQASKPGWRSAGR